MLRLFVVFSLLFISMYIYFSTSSKPDTQALRIGKKGPYSGSYETSNKINDISNHLVNPNPVNSDNKNKKTSLKGVSMSGREIEQLKLRDFQAYLRHEDRVAKQIDFRLAEQVLTPVERKEIAKERLAVRLIDILSSKNRS